MKGTNYKRVHQIRSEIGQLEYRIRVNTKKIDDLKNEMAEELCPYKKGDVVYLNYSPTIKYEVDKIESHQSGWRIVAFKLGKIGFPTLVKKFLLPIDPIEEVVIEN